MDIEELKEFLFIDPDSKELRNTEAGLINQIDPDKLIYLHMQDLKELHNLQRNVRRIRKDFDEGKAGRKQLEDAYTTEMGALFHIAKRFHPLGRGKTEGGRKAEGRRNTAGRLCRAEI